MPTTPYLSLPYPGLNNAPNVPADIQALAFALDAAVVPKSYTPTWTAVTTNPTIGNGTISGQYVRTGFEIDFEVTVKFGTTTTAGSGAWSFSLPVAGAAITDWPWPIGMALFRDEDAALHLPGTATLATTSTMRVMFPNNGTGPVLAFAASTQPATWANLDYLRISGRYRVTS